MTGTELGDMRRTHYSGDITAAMDGTRVVVMGWILSIRGHGNIIFATISDRGGQVPVVAKKGGCPDELRQKLGSLKPHSSVGIAGMVRASEKAPNGYEIVPEELRVFSEVEKTPPFEPAARTVKNIETRLGSRPIDLRRAPVRHMFVARSALLRAVREYFAKEDFTEVNTPKIISTATEGGSALFTIFYYDKEAFLAQSPQLYKEQLTMSFEKVYEIAPIFRAEASRTNRHLSEAISIDIEEAFADYNDVMDRIEKIVLSAAGAVSSYAKGHPDADFEVPDVPEKIPRHKYGDLVERMQKAGAKTEWGDDLYPSNLKKAGLDGFYFITDWPLAPKPFYVKESASDPRVSESFDLMFGDLEISSGSTRVEKRERLAQRLADKGLDPEKFGHHLGAFEYGVPPHAGCGIGLERLMMALTGSENIRDVALFPRDVDRLAP